MNWLTLIIIVGFIFLISITGRKKSKATPIHKTSYLYKDIAFNCLFLLFLICLNTNLLNPIDFSIVGKGLALGGEEFISISTVVVTTTFIMAFTRWTSLYPENIQEEKEMFGYPISHYPDNYFQLFIFAISILTGVIFEELLCRQFLFYLIHATVGLTGDLLLIVTALLFSIGHLYQGKAGLISSFVLGLVFGKIFMIQESILTPIFIHLCFNLTIIPLAFRRIRALQLLEKEKP